MSGGTSRSPSACSIPICTAPRLPPPPSTYPTGRGRSAMLIGLANPGRKRLPAFGALTHDVLQRQAERRGQRGHGEERGGGDAAGLDLAQRLRGDAGHRGDLGHAARPARLAEQGAEPFPAGAFVVTERRSDHTVIVIPV